jgi:hypothetical protein
MGGPDLISAYSKVSIENLSPQEKHRRVGPEDKERNLGSVYFDSEWVLNQAREPLNDRIERKALYK